MLYTYNCRIAVHSYEYLNLCVYVCVCVHACWVSGAKSELEYNDKYFLLESYLSIVMRTAVLRKGNVSTNGES